MWIKAVIVVMLGLILASLFSALVMLLRPHGRGGSAIARALTWRIALSIALFAPNPTAGRISYPPKK
jgi:hypothetical protein